MFKALARFSGVSEEIWRGMMQNGACGGRICGYEVDAFLMSCIKKIREREILQVEKMYSV